LRKEGQREEIESWFQPLSHHHRNAACKPCTSSKRPTQHDKRFSHLSQLSIRLLHSSSIPTEFGSSPSTSTRSRQGTCGGGRGRCVDCGTTRAAEESPSSPSSACSVRREELYRRAAEARLCVLLLFVSASSPAEVELTFSGTSRRTRHRQLHPSLSFPLWSSRQVGGGGFESYRHFKRDAI